MSKLSEKLAEVFGVRSEAGVTAIEYGLLAALIALIIVGAVGTVGTNLSGIFGRVATSVH